MMIGDYDVHAESFGAGNLLDIPYPAVDGDEELGVSLLESLHGIRVQTESLVVPVRDIVFEILYAELLERIVQYHRSGYAVGVVVAVYDDLFIIFYTSIHPFNGLIHILHEERVVGMKVVVRRNESLGILHRRDAPIHQKAREGIGKCGKLFGFYGRILSQGVFHRLYFTTRRRAIIFVWKIASSAR